MLERLSTADCSEGACLFQELVEEQHELGLLNLLKPYEDKVPLVLQAMDIDLIVALFEELDEYYVVKALFGNFQAVNEERREDILRSLSRSKVGLILNRMSVGVDNPKTAGKILQSFLQEGAAEVVEAMGLDSVTRILREMPPEAEARLLSALRPEKIGAMVGVLLGPQNAVRTAKLANALKNLGESDQSRILSSMLPQEAQRVSTQLQASGSGEFDSIELRDAKVRFAEMPVEEAANELLKTDPEKMAGALKVGDTEKAAQGLAAIAQRDPQLAADLLEEINDQIILGFRGRGRDRSSIEEFYKCPAAGILENMDFSLPCSVKAVQLIPTDVLQPILDRMPEGKPTEIARLRQDEHLTPQLQVSLQSFAVGKGSKKTENLEQGLKRTRIEESLDTGDKIKPVVVDLVEMDPKRVVIKACRAITEDGLTPIDDVARLFGDAKREGKRPDKELFTRLSLLQLSLVVRNSRAIAGINGNHYY